MMKATLQCKDDVLYVVKEKDGATGVAREWLPVRSANCTEAQTLQGRPVTSVDLHEAIYVDEEGNVFQLLDKGETKPIEVERLPVTDKTEVEVPPVASLNGKKTHGQNGDSKMMQRKNRNNGRKRQVLPTTGTALQLYRPETTAAGHPTLTPPRAWHTKLLCR